VDGFDLLRTALPCGKEVEMEKKMVKVRNIVGIVLICIPLTILVGCSHNETTPATTGAVNAGPQGPGAAYDPSVIQARIDAVKANTQASPEEKQIVLSELQNAQGRATQGSKPAGQ